MIISNCVRNDDGSLDFDFHVTNEEAGFLMDLAIKTLVHRGLIQVAEEEAEQEFEIFKEDGGIVQ